MKFIKSNKKNIICIFIDESFLIFFNQNINDPNYEDYINKPIEIEARNTFGYTIEINELEKINNFAFAIYNEERYDSKFIHESVNFLHYNGKGKPWQVQYLIYDSSQIYQKEFRKLNLDFYHIVFNLKVKVLVTFLQDVFSFKILKLEKPSLYLYLSIKALFKKLRF